MTECLDKISLTGYFAQNHGCVFQSLKTLEQELLSTKH